MSHRRVRIWPPLAEEWLNMRFGASFWPWGWQWVDDGEELPARPSEPVPEEAPLPLFDRLAE